MAQLMSDVELIERIFHHIDNKTTDRGETVWREPTENYHCPDRFAAELALMRRLPMAFCPSAALPENGSYLARVSAGTPLLVVRGDDGVVRAFRNACRHRGMAVAEGEGTCRAFVCPYHAWTYGLDGKLKHIPDADGFPGLDPNQHGLKQVTAEERGGIVFVTQEDPISAGALEELPDLLSPDQEVFDHLDFVDESNWKLIGETSMEGYHIKALHSKSFYPYGYDNLNVVETQGANSRIVFPFRRIEKLRDKPKDEWRIDGRMVDVYQMFPNAHLSILSNHTMMIILEPLTPTTTRWVIYRLSARAADGRRQDMNEAKRDADFVKDSGLNEDRAAAIAIQKGLAAQANSHFTFGQFEKAIVHFHQNLNALLPKVA